MSTLDCAKLIALNSGDYYETQHAIQVLNEEARITDGGKESAIEVAARLVANENEFLHDEVARLTEDKKRVDWLASQGEPETYEDAPHALVWSVIGEPGERCLRAAIDAARAGGGEAVSYPPINIPGISPEYIPSTASSTATPVFNGPHFGKTDAEWESEVAQLRAEVEELKGALAMGQENCDAVYEDLRDERDQARAEVGRLRELVDSLREYANALAYEWAWKRNSSLPNDREMQALDAAIDAARAARAGEGGK